MDYYDLLDDLGGSHTLAEIAAINAAVDGWVI